MTCSSSVVSCSIRVRLPRWQLVKVRPLWLHVLYSSMPLQETVFTSLLSMITSLSVTPSGWVLSICSTVSRWIVLISISLTLTHVAELIWLTSLSVPIMSSVSTICATIWQCSQRIWCSVATIMLSSMRSIACSLTMRVPLLLSADQCLRAATRCSWNISHSWRDSLQCRESSPLSISLTLSSSSLRVEKRIISRNWMKASLPSTVHISHFLRTAHS